MPICVGCLSKPPGIIGDRPFVGAALRRRQREAPAAIIAQAWTAQARLYRRYHRLHGRGKPNQQVITAVARELTGFVWAALIQ